MFSNQLKTTVGEVMDYSMVTESGIQVAARFGGRSALKRIVNSYAIVGTTTGNLMKLKEKMIEAYRS